jgi:hypothetical protein
MNMKWDIYDEFFAWLKLQFTSKYCNKALTDDDYADIMEGYFIIIQETMSNKNLFFQIKNDEDLFKNRYIFQSIDSDNSKKLSLVTVVNDLKKDLCS